MPAADWLTVPAAGSQGDWNPMDSGEGFDSCSSDRERGVPSLWEHLPRAQPGIRLKRLH